MATATINIRMDERTKRDMEAVCKDLGACEQGERAAGNT